MVQLNHFCGSIEWKQYLRPSVHERQFKELFLQSLASFDKIIYELNRHVCLDLEGSSYTSEKLRYHFDLSSGTLISWKQQAIFWGRVYTHTSLWYFSTIIIIIALFQIQDPYSDLSSIFYTEIVIFTSLLVMINRLFNAENRFKLYKECDSEYENLIYRFIDLPHEFGDTEKDQIELFLNKFQNIRRSVKKGEKQNFPYTKLI